eukprot:7391770-Prymnesium_polylepis.1
MRGHRSNKSVRRLVAHDVAPSLRTHHCFDVTFEPQKRWRQPKLAQLAELGVVPHGSPGIAGIAGVSCDGLRNCALMRLACALMRLTTKLGAVFGWASARPQMAPRTAKQAPQRTPPTTPPKIPPSNAAMRPKEMVPKSMQVEECSPNSRPCLLAYSWIACENLDM